MSVVVRCRRCGAEFSADRVLAVVLGRRLCPRCRGPVPPTGGVPAAVGGLVRPVPAGAAA